MRIFIRVGLGVGLVALAGALFVPAATASGPPAIDVSNHVVTCDSLVGSISFDVPVTTSGPGLVHMTFKGKLSGCIDQTNAASNPVDAAHTVSLAPSTVSTPIAASWGTASCANLSSGLWNPNLTLSVAWKTNAKDAGGNLYPKIYDQVTGIANVGHNTSVIGVSQWDGTTFTSPSSFGGGAGSGFLWLRSGLNIQHGSTIPPNVVGSFTGSSGVGANSTLDVTSNQSMASLQAACVKGIKKITFGIAAIQLG